MKITRFKHNGVKPDGTFADGLGAVETEPGIRLSNPGTGGCNILGCHCSDGYWFCVNFGYDPSLHTVEGVTVHFDDKEEFDKYFGSANN